jgi:D-sedoheptulose 7-phosphate isomerase
VTDSREQAVRDVFAATIRLHGQVQASLAAPIVAAAAIVQAALGGGHKVLAFGNGGSAADAQHLAAELVGRFERDRPALAAIALTADASVLTSVANDEAFDRVFVRQIAALGRPGDVAIGISTSGRSANVVRALEEARRAGLRTIALTGCDGGDAGPAAEVHVNVPDRSTARVQEVHRTILHALCLLVEREM